MRQSDGDQTIPKATELTLHAFSLGPALHSLLYARSDERYQSVRPMVVSALEGIGLGNVAVPEERGNIDQAAGVIMHAIAERLRESKGAIGGDPYAASIFSLGFFTFDVFLLKPLGLECDEQTEAMRLALADLGIEDAFATLDSHINSVHVKEEASGDTTIDPKEAAEAAWEFYTNALHSWVEDSTGNLRAILGDVLRTNPFVIVTPKKVVVQRAEEVIVNRTITFGNGAVINAPVTIADSIENSFNAIDESKVNEELKQLLTQLTTQVVDLAKSSPSPETEGMARDVESLAKEATSTSPRPGTLQGTLKKIKDAAVTVGEIAKPILSTVGALLPLLGVVL